MKPLFFTISFLIILIFLTNNIHAEEVILDDFKGPQLASGWEEKSFVGQTDYFLTKEDDIPCLKAISSGTASGMFNKINFDPAKMPFISWSWKVDSTVPSGNAYHKKSDDYAARVYIVFPSFFFWKTKALNYIWANRLPQESFVVSPYTSNDTMVAVESGSDLVGQWVKETRNIYEDYRKAFGAEPPRVGAIALMTDTDNTGESASACYGPIRIHSSQSP